jgi:hypothetical protein
VNPEILKSAGFGFEPFGCTPGRTCTWVRVLILSLSDFDAIPDGSLLYTCQIGISPRARVGPHELGVFNVVLKDVDASHVASEGIAGGSR